MSLTSQLTAEFDGAIRSRGADYFRIGLRFTDRGYGARFAPL